MSDDDDDDDDDIMLTDEKYRPQSLEKMIALIAMLVEKSRGVDKQLHVSQKDYHSIVGGKASVGCITHGSCGKQTNSSRKRFKINKFIQRDVGNELIHSCRKNFKN